MVGYEQKSTLGLIGLLSRIRLRWMHIEMSIQSWNWLELGELIEIFTEKLQNIY